MTAMVMMVMVMVMVMMVVAMASAVMVMMMSDHNLGGPGAGALCQTLIVGLQQGQGSGSGREGRDSWSFAGVPARSPAPPGQRSSWWGLPPLPTGRLVSCPWFLRRRTSPFTRRPRQQVVARK
jgi:hypothetical protein